MAQPASALDPDELPAFARHLARGTPGRLHHYTGQVGLEGIVEMGELWATKAQYMNDATEFTLGLDLAKTRIEQHLERAGEADLSKLRDLFPRREGIANVNIFVGCFCEEPDLLSQWRGYSGDAYGYSLALNGDTLRKRAEMSGFRLASCIYDENHQIEIIDQLISHCLQQTDQLSRQVQFEAGLILVSTFFKHSAFAQEREWRIASDIKDIREKLVAFRQGKSMLTPYFRVKIGQCETSAIEAATVGPCPHRILSQSAVQMMFLRAGIAKAIRADAMNGSTSPEVHISSIPYRNW